MSILKGLSDLEVAAPVIETGGDIQTHGKMILQEGYVPNPGPHTRQ